MHLTLITSPSPAPTGRLSRAEQARLSSVLWGWLSLATGQSRSALHTDPLGAVLRSAIRSIDQGAWLQDVARLPPMVLSAVRVAAMLAHLPDSTRLLRQWLRLNRSCLYTHPDVDSCREVLRLNTTLEGVSGFDEEEPEELVMICTALVRFQWERSSFFAAARLPGTSHPP